jgi:hypothetical protein
MAKKTMNTSINQATDVVKKGLTELTDKILFSPTARHKQLKARFWARYQPSPFLPSPDKMTALEISKICDSSTIRDSWYIDGFKEWFLNKEEARERLEYLFMKSLDTAEAILDDPAAQASAKVNLIKVLSELSNKFPSRYAEKFADDDIGKMTEQQLKAYLERKGINVSVSEVLEISPSPLSDEEQEPLEVENEEV